MRIQEATSAALASTKKGSAAPSSERSRGAGSTPLRSMSATRINVEEAPDDEREDFVRDVSSQPRAASSAFRDRPRDTKSPAACFSSRRSPPAGRSLEEGKVVVDGGGGG